MLAILVCRAGRGIIKGGNERSVVGGARVGKTLLPSEVDGVKSFRRRSALSRDGPWFDASDDLGVRISGALSVDPEGSRLLCLAEEAAGNGLRVAGPVAAAVVLEFELGLDATAARGVFALLLRIEEADGLRSVTLEVLFLTGVLAVFVAATGTPATVAVDVVLIRVVERFEASEVVEGEVFGMGGIGIGGFLATLRVDAIVDTDGDRGGGC